MKIITRWIHIFIAAQFLFLTSSCEYIRNNPLPEGFWTGFIVGALIAALIVYVIVRILKSLKGKQKIIEEDQDA